MSGLAVRGQERALDGLRELTASSLLFVGPEGVGRRRAARWYAASLNCQSEPGQRPCGTCDSCRRFEESHEGGHPDYREVHPKTETTTGRRNFRAEFRIDQLVPRKDSKEDPLSRWLEQRPAFRRRVGVIDGADRLNQSAANAFLKMLEEPPSYASIILVAPSARSVLPTVASRCAVVRFGAVETSELGFPGHPAHRLGRPGPLMQPPAQIAEAQREVAEFRRSLNESLSASFAAADALAARWSDPEAGDLVELLREEFRDVPPAVRFRVDDLFMSTEEAIAGYSSATLALRVLAMELRAALEG